MPLVRHTCGGVCLEANLHKNSDLNGRFNSPRTLRRRSSAILATMAVIEIVTHPKPLDIEGRRLESVPPTEFQPQPQLHCRPQWTVILGGIRFRIRVPGPQWTQTNTVYDMGHMYDTRPWPTLTEDWNRWQVPRRGVEPTRQPI